MSTEIITISMPEPLALAMDEKVAALDTDRSKYLRRLIRQDLVEAGLIPTVAANSPAPPFRQKEDWQK